MSTAAVVSLPMLDFHFMGNPRPLPMYMDAVTIRMCSSVNPRLPSSLMRSRQVDAIEAFLALPDCES